MKHIYQVELYFNNGTSKVWALWGFTTYKKAIEFGEYKYRTWDDVEYYRIRKTDINPDWFSLKQRNYKYL